MFYLAKFYSFLFGFFHDVFHINMPFISKILNLIKNDHIIKIDNQKLYLNSNIANCYVRLINGQYAEPETHIFFRNILGNINFNVNFIDIGASVGEMILDMACQPKVRKVYAFEPLKDCTNVLKINCLLNNYNHVQIIEKPLSNEVKTVFIDKKGTQQSKINHNLVKNTDDKIVVKTTTIDNEFSSFDTQTIILIDVEGHELEVLKGGEKFITENKPLIIFEYNFVSEKYYSLKDIKTILGKNYLLFRLNRKGNLDIDFSRTWNCVAIHNESMFYNSINYLTNQEMR
jgi:FkbM family methyltransferase